MNVKKRNGIENNDRGFSLIELIVAILIMSVIMLAVVTLIASSRAAYRGAITEATIQGETETVRNFINEIAIEAKDYGIREVGDAGNKCLWFLAPNNEVSDKSEYCYYCILFEKAADDNGTLRYKKLAPTINVDTVTDIEPYLSDIVGDDYSLLAEHVKSIMCTKVLLSTGKADPLIIVDLGMSFNGSTQEKRLMFAGRNIGR